MNEKEFCERAVPILENIEEGLQEWMEIMAELGELADLTVNEELSLPDFGIIRRLLNHKMMLKNIPLQFLNMVIL